MIQGGSRDRISILNYMFNFLCLSFICSFFFCLFIYYYFFRWGLHPSYLGFGFDLLCLILKDTLVMFYAWDQWPFQLSSFVFLFGMNLFLPRYNFSFCPSFAFGYMKLLMHGTHANLKITILESHTMHTRLNLAYEYVY